MTDDFATLYARTAQSAASILTNLAELESTIADLEQKIGGLPFFVRGFVSSQVSKGTGQDVPAWNKTIKALTATLRQVQEAAGNAGAEEPSAADRTLYTTARAQIDGARPGLERLASFMESVPSKLGAIPPGLLQDDQRGEFLQAVAQQTQALHGALAEMPTLSEALQGLI